MVLQMINIAVVGSRSFNNYNYLHSKLTGFLWDLLDQHTRELPPGPAITIISGGARGADSIAEQWANAWDYPIKIFPAEWDKYGKSAGYRRNIDIVDNCDMLIAFWDGTSRGTKHSIDIAEKQGKPVIIFKDWTDA